MTTTTISFMAIWQIVLMGAALLLILRYTRKLSEVKQQEKDLCLKAEEIDLLEKRLRKQKNDLDLMRTQMCRQIRTEIPTRHVRVSIISDIPSKGKGFIPRTEYKQLASKLGYKLLANVKHHVTAEKQQDNKTVYTVDVEYVQ